MGGKNDDALRLADEFLSRSGALSQPVPLMVAHRVMGSTLLTIGDGLHISVMPQTGCSLAAIGLLADCRRCQAEGSRQQHDAGTHEDEEETFHERPINGSVIRSGRSELLVLRPGLLPAATFHEPHRQAFARVEQRLNRCRHRATSLTSL
jgi:hypothetical protein